MGRSKSVLTQYTLTNEWTQVRCKLISALLTSCLRPPCTFKSWHSVIAIAPSGIPSLHSQAGKILYLWLISRIWVILILQDWFSNLTKIRGRPVWESKGQCSHWCVLLFTVPGNEMDTSGREQSHKPSVTLGMCHLQVTQVESVPCTLNQQHAMWSLTVHCKSFTAHEDNTQN